jgi:FKBP-type peptidyl-prolyl cis-trans isomerase FkpA
VFDQGKAPLAVREVVPGFSQALQQMQAGGKYKVVIPAKLAYGDKAVGPIPANSDLYFDIEVLGVMSRQQFEQQRQLMQMLQAQQQGGAAGAAGGAAPQALPQP